MSGSTRSRLRNGRRLKRMLKRQGKRGVVLLNLVSMIDIFTTLVFFLLIITTNVAALRNPRSMNLPNSIATQQPTDTPVIMVTPRNISLQGVRVMTTSSAANATGVLDPLKTALQNAPMLHVQGGKPQQTTRGDINIMADKEIPYSLLKKVMMTCGAADFARISLSVNHVGKPGQ
jgi:Biopolymer transport protein ExbD/TolR.